MSNGDFGPGSQGNGWAPPPGFEYAGDAWCYVCNNYVPAQRAADGRAYTSVHSLASSGQQCPGALRQVEANKAPEGAEESEA